MNFTTEKRIILKPRISSNFQQEIEQKRRITIVGRNHPETFFCENANRFRKTCNFTANPTDQSINPFIDINKSTESHASISKHYVPIFCWRFFQVIRHVDNFHIRRWCRRNIPSGMRRRWSQFLDISVQKYFIVCHIFIFTDIIECYVFFRRLRQILRAVGRIVRHFSLTNAALNFWNLAKQERSRKEKIFKKNITYMAKSLCGFFVKGLDAVRSGYRTGSWPPTLTDGNRSVSSRCRLRCTDLFVRRVRT